MRLLFAIAHFYNPQGSGRYGSERANPQPRLQALTSAIASIHQIYSASQCMLDIRQRLTVAANQPFLNTIDIIVCTTRGLHLLDQLPLPPHFYHHAPTQCEPMLLGFQCQAMLRDNLGSYDYYCFLEDDLILSDPWFFLKLVWFNRITGDRNLLQPNRYEISPEGLFRKAYIDGDIRPQATQRFQNIQEHPQLTGKVMECPVVLHRPLNPHSGCYFLNAAQMDYWSNQPYFLDQDTSFIGPLESAATLGIMKTFRVYKPAPQNANFLEIQHFGTNYLSLIGKEIKVPDPTPNPAPELADTLN